ncbi:MAG: hypothetical protein HYU99_05485 [Deltaproteobacteria bacterium]|nr:hypothetical protein [Deltaproteobacteria bacterium]
MFFQLVFSLKEIGELVEELQCLYDEVGDQNKFQRKYPFINRFLESMIATNLNTAKVNHDTRLKVQEKYD